MPIWVCIVVRRVGGMITKRHLSVHRCCARLFSDSIKDDTFHLIFIVASFFHILLLMSLLPNSITSHESFVETNHLPCHSPGPGFRRMDPSERPSLILSRIYPVAQELSPLVRHRLPSPISPLRLDGPSVKLPSIYEWLAEGKKIYHRWASAPQLQVSILGLLPSPSLSPGHTPVHVLRGICLQLLCPENLIFLIFAQWRMTCLPKI